MKSLHTCNTPTKKLVSVVCSGLILIVSSTDNQHMNQYTCAVEIKFWCPDLDDLDTISNKQLHKSPLFSYVLHAFNKRELFNLNQHPPVLTRTACSFNVYQSVDYFLN